MLLGAAKAPAWRAELPIRAGTMGRWGGTRSIGRSVDISHRTPPYRWRSRRATRQSGERSASVRRPCSPPRAHWRRPWKRPAPQSSLWRLRISHRGRSRSGGPARPGVSCSAALTVDFRTDDWRLIQLRRGHDLRSWRSRDCLRSLRSSRSMFPLGGRWSCSCDCLSFRGRWCRP